MRISRIFCMLSTGVLLAGCQGRDVVGPQGARPSFTDEQCLPGDPCGTDNSLSVDVWSGGRFTTDRTNGDKTWVEMYSGNWVVNGSANSTVTAVGYKSENCTGPLLEFARKTASRTTAGKVEALIVGPRYYPPAKHAWRVQGTHTIVPDYPYVGGGTFYTSWGKFCY